MAARSFSRRCRGKRRTSPRHGHVPPPMRGPPGCVSGIALDTEQIAARTDAEAVSEAEPRFARLLGHRSGLAVLKDDAGRTIWTARSPVPSHASGQA